ncbi:hypothetical protein ABLO26_25475 [Neobacillus sp. 179-J 1A1 HS]|uniref:hypothetical protein n=1 Tax=Neobacillus driksii TaxID=3035913 RepID=UPI0035BC576D
MSKNKIRKTLCLNTTTEKDIPLIERIQSVQNFNDYIKRLIEKDIKSRKIVKVESKPNQFSHTGNTTSNLVITKGTTLTLKAE